MQIDLSREGTENKKKRSFLPSNEPLASGGERKSKRQTSGMMERGKGRAAAHKVKTL
jgi:hypothetical protein